VLNEFYRVAFRKKVYRAIDELQADLDSWITEYNEGAVVAEVAQLSMTASRRLQLAAENSGSIGIAVRRWRRQTEAADFGQPTASVTRWRVSVLPSTPLPVPGVGRARWLLELIRCRAGESADFEVEACDAEGRLAFPSYLADGPDAKEAGRRRASA